MIPYPIPVATQILRPRNEAETCNLCKVQRAQTTFPGRTYTYQVCRRCYWRLMFSME